ncbi:carboxymuconolactone decarboxylase family protein [Gordonia sp. ABSL1-1]|uniref:carboxymuconolactone decarboxylase family protein n=1 Tax=Gordonia sp. ABSL1-1 TaxID=3053923 RepID=UPI0025736CF1|nr:carboxymuconolactone decarboxylase family protein [Gordonia sp. ABSL1-1]MDL9936474.1 carboxymuconolactone decarboxylase family protein [Gordonia sp. ABSL1-1]
MRAARRILAFIKVFAAAKRNRVDLYRWLIRRPLLLAANGFYEFALLFSNRLDPRLKELAELKTAGLINCEYCLDIGSALAVHGGIGEAQLRDLPVYRDSPAYSEPEKLVLEFAEVMTLTPAVGDDLADVRTRLAAHLSDTQIAELAATIAWENQRARLNQALGVRPTGMSDGAACALPESRK